VELAPEWPKINKNEDQNTPNNPNCSWRDHLYHPHRRFFFDPELSSLEDSFVDGRARTEPKGSGPRLAFGEFHFGWFGRNHAFQIIPVLVFNS